MELTQRQLTQRGEAFRELHRRPGIFAIPNPWDAGSAIALAQLGFEALATTSAGLAHSLGKPDGHCAVSRDETLANAAAIATATPLPVSADLENGFGDSPDNCALTIRAAGEAGLVGGSIEDATGRADDPIYPFDAAVARVRAAVAAARALPFPFMLSARSENFLHGRPDLDDTIRRLVAFADAGADVLFAPGLRTSDDIAAVVRAVAPKPVNVIMGLSGVALALADLEALGVKRVSVGSSLARAAFGAFLRAAREIREQGTFGYAADAVPYADLNRMFSRTPSA
ncbi:MAG TPA: isocitrate lyase/phosphoenolpyruvate mutase family protein [Casimicrobiaceae bacterium]